MSSEPEMSDAQFTNVFSIMIGGLILLTIGLIILAAIVASGVRQSNINQQVRDEQMIERIQPAGQVAVGEAAATTASASGATGGAASGETVYQNACAACHAAGVAGAPAFGDSAAWSARIDKGEETLYDHAINGFQGDAGMMPAKGGNTSLSDEEVKAAVDHMVEAVASSGETATGSASSGGESETTDAASGSADEPDTTDSTSASNGGSGSTESTSASTDGSGTTASAGSVSGESVYQQSCAACHAAGVAGAPKLGDAAGWSDRVSKGMETLYDNAINGFQGETGMMPAKGGFTNLSDEEVKAAVDYMVEAVE